MLASPPRTEGHPFNLNVLNDGNIVATYSGRRNSAGEFTESSGVFVSSDNGLTWQDRSNNYMYYWTRDITIDPHDPDQNTWYVCVFSNSGNNNGGVYRTYNRGVSWTKIFSIDNAYSISINPNNPNIAYLSTNKDGLFYSDNFTDPNPTFTLLEQYYFLKPTRVFFNPYNNEIWVTSFGNGLKKAIIDINSLKNINELNVKVSPNPANDYFIVSDESFSSETSTITIHDMFGKQVYSDSFVQRTKVITKDIKSGFYIVVIQQRENKLVYKILVRH